MIVLPKLVLEKILSDMQINFFEILLVFYVHF